MKSRPRIAILFPLILMVFARVPDASAVPSVAQPPGLEKLVALLCASSFREADKLAVALLAVPEAAEPSTLAVCGLAVLKAGRVKEAEALFEKAISRSPENPEAHLGLGRIDRIRNDSDLAISHFRKAVSSAAFFEEALRQLWRAAWDRGRVDDLAEIRDLAVERFGRESKPLFSLFTNGFNQVRDLSGKRLFQMEGRFDRLDVPLLSDQERVPGIRMTSLRLNGKEEYPFDIDSAAADFLTLSPLLAEELGLSQTGSSTASGVGTATAAVRFSMLDKVELGTVTFRNVPVMVSDIQPFRGLKKGLLGTGLLKRFNVAIDADAGVMTLFPLDRPDLLHAGIDRTRIATDVPLYLFDQTVVEASLAGAPPALYILDTAAATNLVDAGFFAEHIKPKLDPSRIVRGGIRGAQGAQYVNRIDDIPIVLGSLTVNRQSAHEFRMDELNMIGGRYAAGLLGNPLLWPYRVHMDFKAGRLIIEKRPKS
jgi:hypothetical protein